jgi:hypothetical protein
MSNNKSIQIKYETIVCIDDVFDEEGVLVIFKYEDKFYWGINDGCPYLSDFSEIPESLYNEILKHNKGLKNEKQR